MPSTSAASKAASEELLTTGPNAGQKLNLSDKKWDRMGLLMDRFHNAFRMEYRSVFELADTYEKRGLTLKQFLSHARGFHQHLEMHHTIEEHHIFPILGKRMPSFKMDSGEHVQQHKEIHAGLDKYEAYLVKCTQQPSKYSADELRAIMKSFEEVLFLHLDEEVLSLKGKNMSKYWTLDEIARLPM